MWYGKSTLASCWLLECTTGVRMSWVLMNPRLLVMLHLQYLLLRQIGMDIPCLDQSAGVALKIKMELYFTYLPRWVNMATNKNMFTSLLLQVGHFGFYGIVKEQAYNSSCLVCWYQTTDGVAYHAIKGCNVVYVTRSDIATCNG